MGRINTLKSCKSKIKSVYAEYFAKSKSKRSGKRHQKIRKSFVKQENNELDKEDNGKVSRKFTLEKPKFYNPILRTMYSKSSNNTGSWSKVSLQKGFTLNSNSENSGTFASK